MIGGIADDMMIARDNERARKLGNYTAIAAALTEKAKSNYGVDWTIDYNIKEQPVEAQVGYRTAETEFWQAVHDYAYRRAVEELASPTERVALEKPLKSKDAILADIEAAAEKLKEIFGTEEWRVSGLVRVTAQAEAELDNYKRVASRNR
jgi:hypothetical protein